MRNPEAPSPPSRPPDRIEIARALPESSDAEARKRRSEGDAAFRAGDLEAAEAAYRAALTADAVNIRAHHNLGAVFYRRGEWETACACFERCAELGPGDPDLRFKIGLCLLRQDRAKVAQQAFCN